MASESPPEGAGTAGTDTGFAERGRDAQSAPSPAVRGRAIGRRGWAGASQEPPLAGFLGWLSVGLGASQLLMPRAMTRMIGVAPTRNWTLLMRVLGLRELATGVGVLRNRKSKEWLGARVAGDVMDLGLLGVALAASRRPARTLGAAAAVLGVTMLDLVGAERLAERRKARLSESDAVGGTAVLRSVTIERPVQDVYSFWRDFANFPQFMRHVESVEIIDAERSRWRASGPGGSRAEWVSEIIADRPNEAIAWRSVEGSEIRTSGEVRFQPTRDGATVVTVEMRYRPPAGALGAVLLKLFRREPGQQIGDDLRRLKQLLETGEVLVSEATVADRPHAARPPQRTLH